MNQRLRKKKSIKVIDKYLPYFENMMLPIIEIAEKIDVAEFRTHEQKMREIIEKQFQTTDGNEILKSLSKMFLGIDLSSFSKEINKQLKSEIREREKNDIRFKELHRIVNETEKLYPNISIVILFRNSPFEDLVKAFEPYDLIKEFKNQKGEKAAKTAIRIYREVVEMLYENYVKAICEFTELLEGKKQIKSYQSLGVLVDQLPRRLNKLGYSELIDADAGWIRNAACHGQWKYIPEKNKIALWDKKKTGKEFSAQELFEKSMGMYNMIMENYNALIFIYLKSKMANEWLWLLKFFQKNFNQLIINNKPEKLKYMKERIEKMFAPIMKLEFKRQN